MKPHVSHINTLAAALLGFALISNAGLAQNAPTKAVPAEPVKASPVPSEPGTTTASFGDWVLRCQRMPDGSPSKLICEIATLVQVQGQTAPIAQLAIGRVARGEKLHATMVLPSNISLPSTVHLGGETAGKGLELAWVRCLPGACYANALLPDDMIKAMKTASEPWKAVFKDAAGRDITIPVSMRGMAPAFEALAKEAGG